MQYNHNIQNKVAVINDITGFGRCSLAVSIPVISKLKVQCCFLPTAILSNHTGFDSHFLDDYTRNFENYENEWKKLNLQFEGIYTGFLGSAIQADLVKSFINSFKTSNTIICIDPIMGDEGKKYKSYTTQMCLKMRDLIRYADIITPNLTEACILTDTPFHEGKWKKKEIENLIFKLSDFGPKKIVITGISEGNCLANYCFDESGKIRVTRQHKVGKGRGGTGDIFASILIADAINGKDFYSSVKKASHFIRECLVISDKMGIPTTDGVAFEECLDFLKA